MSVTGQKHEQTISGFFPLLVTEQRKEKEWPLFGSFGYAPSPVLAPVTVGDPNKGHYILENRKMPNRVQLLTCIENQSVFVSHLRIDQPHKHGLLDQPVIIGALTDPILLGDTPDDFGWPSTGVLMMAAHGLTSEDAGEVLIPVSELDGLTDEQIGKIVRLTAKYAEWAHAENDARRYLNALQNGGDEAFDWAHYTFEEFYVLYLDSYKRAVHWQDKSQAIADYVNALTPYIEGRNRDAGYIYCLHDGAGHYKIGRTATLTTRIQKLGTQPPFPTELVWAFRVISAVYFEKQLHEEYAEYRFRGEWFRMRPEIASDIPRGRAFTFYDINGQPYQAEYQQY